MPREKTSKHKASGLYTRQITIGYDGRRRIRQTLYAKTAKELERKVREALDARDKGRLPQDGNVKLGHYLEQWLRDHRQRVRETTAKRYEGLIQIHVIPALGHVKLRDLNLGHVHRLMAHVSESGRTSATANRVRSVLAEALRDAVASDLIVKNYASLAKPFEEKRAERDVLTEEQARSLILACYQEERLGPLFVVALALGLRQGEALGLKWDDVLWHEGRVRVWEQLKRLKGEGGATVLVRTSLKNDRTRRLVRLPDVALEALARQRTDQAKDRLRAGAKWQDTGYVFTTTVGTPIDAGNLRRAWYRIQNRAGLSGYRFHDLRHTCASLLLARDVPMKVVQETLGHSRLSTTVDIYGHRMPGTQDRAAEAIDAVFG